ncbi:RCC1 domain-containing protein 1-like [Liolophura sinensis]|uniref:RCC1 domain-containing protein 1-like n=1 Tax=Liolophura sinensis TaxID=3198878 RepID=UPI00315961D3
MSQCLLSWSSMLCVNDFGSAFISNHNTFGWSRLETHAKVTSAAVKWTDFWLLLDDGKLQTFNEEGCKCDGLTVKRDYVVTTKGDNSQQINLSFLAAGENSLLGCSEDGRCGELEFRDKDSSDLQPLVTWNPLSLPCQVTQVTCGKEHTVVLSETGQIYTCGLGSRGQLGHNSTESSLNLTLVEQLEGLRIACVSAGGWHTVAVSDIGDVYVWGWNESGQLGLPCKTLHDKLASDKPSEPLTEDLVVLMCEPCLVNFSTELTIVDVSCGSRHTAIVTDKGDLLMTGWNNYGQLGLGDTETRDRFTAVTGLKQRHLVVERVNCGYWGTLIWTAESADNPSDEKG